MTKIKKFGLGITAAIVVLVSLWMYHAHGLYEKSYTSEYQYGIMVQTDSVLHDVTLYLPLPVFEEKSKIGDEIMAGNASKRDDWDCRIVETEHGKMFEISAEEIAPEFRPLPVPLPPESIEPGEVETPASMPEGISVTVAADHDINTRNPIGNEPLLSPKYNLTRSTCELPYPEGRIPPNCYEYESRIYADYTASPNAKFSIYIELEGRNSWWIYGWSGNEYRDNVNVTLVGKSMDGMLHPGGLLRVRAAMAGCNWIRNVVVLKARLLSTTLR